MEKIIISAILLISSVIANQANAATYDVIGVFVEPVTVIGHTTFTGTFNWDAATETISGLQGSQNVTMYDPSQFPDLNLNYQLAQNVDGNIVTASVFLQNSTDVFMYGGYTKGDAYKYGISFDPNIDGGIANQNAYFSFAFDKTTMEGIVDKMVYGDCTAGGLMGVACMTGHSATDVGYTGTMAAYPSSLSITEVSAVPVPAAAWLFGGALVGLFQANRRKNILQVV